MAVLDNAGVSLIGLDKSTGGSGPGAPTTPGGLCTIGLAAAASADALTATRNAGNQSPSTTPAPALPQAYSRKLIPDRLVAERYGVTLMTVWRWDHDRSLRFPQPFKIRGRKYRDESELDAFDERMRRQPEPTHGPQLPQAQASVANDSEEIAG
jgi:hypothetical protein